MKICAQYIPNRTVLTETALPAYKMCLIVHVRILAVILSTKSPHSTFVSLLAVMGIPRYLNGSLPSANPVASRHSFCMAVHSPPKIICDLCRLAFRPMQLVNTLKAPINSWTVVGFALQKKSFANMRCVIPISLQWGWNSNPSCALTCLKSLDKYSIVRTNSSGERGSPYFSPF